MANTGTVIISKCDGYLMEKIRSSIVDSILNLGQMEDYIKPGYRVLIKPNLLLERPPEAAATTHPAVIEAIVSLVIDYGGYPVIGDSPALGSAEKVYATTGMYEIGKRYNIEVVPFNRPETLISGSKGIGGSICVDKTALEVDSIINVPKLKAHAQVGMTGAVKNMFGCVVGARKFFWHLKAGDRGHRFGEMLMAVYNILSPSLNIADAVIAMEGDGPVKGSPRKLGLIAISEDGVALDHVLCNIIGLSPSRVETLAAAKLIGHPSAETVNIRIIGPEISDLALTDFRQAVKSPIRFRLTHILFSMARRLLKPERASSWK